RCDAWGEWSRVGGPTGPIAPRDACPLRVRLHGRRDCPPRDARAWPQLPPEAVHARRPRAQGAGGAGLDMTALTGSYDLWPVRLSVVIAILAAGAALDVVARVAATRGRARASWLVGGAFAMGLGLWSMHYTGMLAS